jgi:hypothetical protein
MDDATRELEKVLDVLRACARHFNAEAEMNAALHLSDKVLPNPLASKVNSAVMAAELALERWRDDI